MARRKNAKNPRILKYTSEICDCCGNSFQKSNYKKSNICSPECERKIKNEEKEKQYEGKIEGVDYLVCPECGEKHGELNLLHAKSHGYDTLKAFRKANNLESGKPQARKDAMKGDKNYGYQHVGTLSPFSNKSLVHTPEQRAIARAKRLRPNGSLPVLISAPLFIKMQSESSLSARDKIVPKYVEGRSAVAPFGI